MREKRAPRTRSRNCSLVSPLAVMRQKPVSPGRSATQLLPFGSIVQVAADSSNPPKIFTFTVIGAFVALFADEVAGLATRQRGRLNRPRVSETASEQRRNGNSYQGEFR